MEDTKKRPRRWDLRGLDESTSSSLLLQDRQRRLGLIGGQRHVAGFASSFRFLHERSSLRHVRPRSLGRSGGASARPRSLHVLVTARSLDVLVAARSLDILVTTRRLHVLVTARGLDVLVAARGLDILVTTGRLHVLVTARGLDVLVAARGLDILVTTGRLHVLVTARGLDVLVAARSLHILITARGLDILASTSQGPGRLHVLVAARGLVGLVLARASQRPRGLNIVGLHRRRLLAQQVLRLRDFRGAAAGLSRAQSGRERHRYRHAENRCKQLLHCLRPFHISYRPYCRSPRRLPTEPGASLRTRVVPAQFGHRGGRGAEAMPLAKNTRKVGEIR